MWCVQLEEPLICYNTLSVTEPLKPSILYLVEDTASGTGTLVLLFATLFPLYRGSLSVNGNASELRSVSSFRADEQGQVWAVDLTMNRNPLIK